MKYVGFFTALFGLAIAVIALRRMPIPGKTTGTRFIAVPLYSQSGYRNRYRERTDRQYGYDAFERTSLDPRTGERSVGGGFLDYARSFYGNAFFPTSTFDASQRRLT